MSCKICYEPCKSISPCGCTGSMRYVHPECLLKWRQMHPKNRCEICHQPYRVPDHAQLAFLMFCLGMLAHKYDAVWLTIFLPFPFRYFAVGAFVANHSFM